MPGANLAISLLFLQVCSFLSKTLCLLSPQSGFLQLRAFLLSPSHILLQRQRNLVWSFQLCKHTVLSLIIEYNNDQHGVTLWYPKKMTAVSITKLVVNQAVCLNEDNVYPWYAWTSLCKLQSNRNHQQTNIQLFTGWMPFLLPNQQCRSTEEKQVSRSYRILKQLIAARQSGRFNWMHGALRALHVSLNNATIRTACKCLKRNNGHLTTLNLNGIWGAMHKAILKPSSEAHNSFWIKIALHKILDIFPQVQLTRLPRVLQVVWQEYMNNDGRHSKHLSLLKKVFSLTAFVLSWIVETIFDNVSTAILPWLLMLTGCLHVPIVGPTGRSDPGYVRLSVRPVGQTGRTDCSQTALICQSHQCGLLADYL